MNCEPAHDSNRALELVDQDASPGTLVRGASDRELDELARLCGRLPGNLREWFGKCGGASVSSGVLLGAGSDEGWTVGSVYDLYPNWVHQGWIPIANDGFGNYYVVDETRDGSVGFVEAVVSPDRIGYYAASTLEIFLSEWLLNGMEKRNWPFERSRIERLDPALLRLSPLPWD